jgi:hypothetical protein
MPKNTGMIVKSKTTERFTILQNDLVRSKDLTLEEKGMLSYLLSLPSNYVLYKYKLYEYLEADKKGSIDRVFKSLQDKNYICSVRVHSEDGTFQGWNHVVYDVPATPTSRKADIGESACIIKNTTSYNKNTENNHFSDMFDNKVENNKKVKECIKKIK